jgi:glucosylceramidase
MSDGGMPTSNTVHVYQTSRNAGAGGAPDHMADKGTVAVSTSMPSGGTTITVDLTQPRQTIVGFGASLTESSASVVSGLPSSQQHEILNAYFAPSGSGYTMARTHIGSCDFALSQYSYDDTNDNCPDKTLPNFSIQHDQALLLPFIKSAMAVTGGALKVVASPWSAPGWMKDNGSMQGSGGYDGALLQQCYPTYASYLSKYLQAYKAAGVPIWGMTPQNEAVGVGGSREGMQWTPDQMNTFIRDDLGPQLKADGVSDTQVFVFDHNKAEIGTPTTVWPTTILQDHATNPFVAGTAVHWYNSAWETYDSTLDSIHWLDTSKAILFDEGCAETLGDTGSGQYSPGYQYAWMSDDFYWTITVGDWGYWQNPSSPPGTHGKYHPVYRYIRDIIAGLNHWYIGFIDWNAVLDKDAGPSHIYNPVLAGIMVDTSSSTSIYYTPIYYAMQHFSKFIRPQARVMTTTTNVDPSVPATDYNGNPTQDGHALLATAARNTDNSVAVVVFNETNAPIPYTVIIGSSKVANSIPAQSLQTLIWQ